MWLELILLISPFVGCTYWLVKDDERMYNSYMSECRDRQIKNDEIVDRYKCGEEFVDEYRKAIGRNP